MEGLSDQRIQEVLERLHLLAFREKHPMSLSGGQKQRLAVATAMLSQKPLLVFDEPTSGSGLCKNAGSGLLRTGTGGRGSGGSGGDT